MIYQGLLVSESGEIRDNRGKTIRQFDNGHGYIYVCANKKHLYVHRLVAGAFMGPCEDGMEVNHIDGIKKNNGRDNLEYVTHERNMAHASDLKLFRPLAGEDSPKAKLTWDQVRQIRAEYKPWSKQNGFRALAKRFGVSVDTVQDIAANRIWKEVRV